MSRRYWTVLGIAAALALALAVWIPRHLCSIGVSVDYISAYGTWVGAGIVAAVGLLAIPQLATTKKSVDAQVFLTVCEQIDDETFGRNYELCRRDSARFQGITIGADKALTFAGPDSPALRDAAMDVLYTLEQVGIIFHHSALNKDMIAEYVGDIAVNSYAALAPVISVFQKRDKEMFERVVELRDYCVKNGWKEDVAETLPFTRLK